MASSMAPGSLIWDPNDCTGFTANPILPGSNSSRVCGFQTQDESDLGNCCQTPIQKYTCWTYCATTQTYADFSTCVSGIAKRNISDVFCLSATNSTIHQEATSAATPRTRAPTMASLLVLLCVLVFFLDPASAEIIPSLAKQKARRADDSSCQFKEDHHYVRLGNTQVVSPSSSGYGKGIIMDISTGIENNNRTINGTSAAEPEYDDFFEILSKQFGRPIPAMSSLETLYEFSVDSPFYVRFTPFNWCVNGTATGCGDVLRDMDGTVPLVACGPVFVSDSNSTQSVEDLDGATIQGNLGTVVSVP